MTLWKITLLLAVAYSQVKADIIPADFVENVRRNHGESSGDSSRILSGWEAYPGQFPHHAALRMTNSVGTIFGCGGSVVHREWVISAAHCTARHVNIVVRAGVVAFSNPEYISETHEWYNYPTYDDTDTSTAQPNDISIIKLVVPITYSPLLQPIRLQSRADAFRDYNREVMMASGHGRLWTDGPQPENLNWVYLRAISNVACRIVYGDRLITSNAICAQGYNVTTQNVCHGDSGGPLMHVASDGKYDLIGVASFVAGGVHGCHSGHPGAFIRTGPFHSWFTQITGLDFENLEDSTTEAPTTTTIAPTTEAETEVPTTTYAPTVEPETEPEEETEAPEPEEEEEEEEDSSEEDSDEELSELLKKLEVKVKVKVRMNKYGKKKEIKHKHEHEVHL